MINSPPYGTAEIPAKYTNDITYQISYSIRFETNLRSILFISNAMGISISYDVAIAVVAFTAGRSIANTWMACVIWRCRLLLERNKKQQQNSIKISIDPWQMNVHFRQSLSCPTTHWCPQMRKTATHPTHDCNSFRRCSNPNRAILN